MYPSTQEKQQNHTVDLPGVTNLEVKKPRFQRFDFMGHLRCNYRLRSTSYFEDGFLAMNQTPARVW